MRRPTSAELERIEIEAFEDVFRAAPPGGGLTTRRFATATAFALDDASTSICSRVLGLGVGTAATSDEVDRVLEHMGQRTGRYQVALSPEARPSRLLEALLARGLVPGYAWMKFSRDAGAPPPEVECPHDVRRVETRRDAEAFAALLMDLMQLPQVLRASLAALPGRAGWACFVAGERPVAAGAVFVKDGLGWLGFGATRPDNRRHGAHRALLAARIRAARDLGAHTLGVDTGVRGPGLPEGSYRNLLWAGFRETYVRANLRGERCEGRSTSNRLGP